MIRNIVAITHQIMAQTVKPGQTVLDATVGKGNDTAYLAELVGTHGRVYGFDIQAQAIALTKKRLAAQSLLTQTTLFQAGHEQIKDLLPREKNLQLAIFNLGYLPSGDKTIITQTKTSLQAISQVLPLLQPGGLLLIAAYPGHAGGLEEYLAIHDYLTQLPQRQYHVGKFEFINQQNLPPKLLIVERS